MPKTFAPSPPDVGAAIANVRERDAGRAVTRRRGRPLNAQRDNIDQKAIILAALDMTRNTSLEHVSISAVADVLSISQNLVRYYSGTRLQLTSGVIDAFLGELLQRWPVQSNNWLGNLRDASRAIYEHFLRYPGMCEYAVCHCSSRLFMLDISTAHVSGLDVLNRFIGLIRASNLAPSRVSVFSDLFLLFLANAAHPKRRDVGTAEDRAFFREKVKAMPSHRYPNVAFAHGATPLIFGPNAFEEGLDLLLWGIANEAAKSNLCPHGKGIDFIPSGRTTTRSRRS
jgi:hypothetical protein